MLARTLFESTAPLPDPIRKFPIELGAALQAAGAPAHAVEDAMCAVATRIGMPVQPFSTPTALFAAFDDGETVLIRTEPQEANLERLAELGVITREVTAGKLAVRTAQAKLRQVAASPERYGPTETIVAFGVVSAAAARIFEGGLAEVLAALSIGLLVGGLSRTTAGHPRASRLLDMAAALLATVIAHVAAHWAGPMSVYVTVLAGLIMLVPGLTLTVAVTELSTRHLASGTARLAKALTTFLSLAVGVALGAKVAGALLGAPPADTTVPLASWSVYLALLVAPVAFVVLFKARASQLPVIFGAAMLGYLGARAGATIVEPKLAAFFGALVVGLYGHAVSRVRGVPATVSLVPGILFLVPGSLGFASLSALLADDAATGMASAFSMTLVAGAIAAGLQVATVMLPPRGQL